MADRVDQHGVLLHPRRSRIYDLLSCPRGLTELSAGARCANSSVLWHLSKLKAAGLVKQAGARYSRVETAGKRLAEAARLLRSVPARELMEHLVDHPGEHLGQAASHLGAPRSRFWRVLPRLQAAGLVTMKRRGWQAGDQALLLAPTAIAREALRVTRSKEWSRIRAQRSRVRQAPAMGTSQMSAVT